MIPRARIWFLVRISLAFAGLIILFFSGIFPFEDLLQPQTQTASVVASDVASLTNEQRVENGFPALAVSPLLTEAAQEKANDMAQNSYYAHISPDGKTPLYWLDHVGYRYLNAGENLVIDRTTSEAAVTAWMNSPDHRENILRPQFTEIGVGVSKGEYDGIDTIFVVQEFGTPYPTARTVAPKPSVQVTTPAVPAKVAAPAPTPTPAVTPKPIVPSVPNPASIPHIATLAPVKPSVPVTAPISVEQAPAAPAAAGQGTSTVSYALAPEFYTPVTLSSRESVQNEAQSAAPQGASESLFGIWIGDLKVIFKHIFHPSS